MGEILKTPIVNEVEQSFLDYSLSVITDRAIPSAEDGLKPVARRILYDMFDKGYFNNKSLLSALSLLVMPWVVFTLMVIALFMELYVF